MNRKDIERALEYNKKDIEDCLFLIERDSENEKFLKQSIESLKILNTIQQALQSALDDGWQPIETAPKDFVDGSYFVGQWILGTDGDKIDTMRWTTEYPCSKGVWMRYYEPTEYISNICHWKPTHWRPLPPPPQDKEE